jgi:type IV pilus assembly protein PilY1
LLANIDYIRSGYLQTASPANGWTTITCSSTGGTSDTLSDVAMYYYETDLRDASLGNCTGAASTDFPSGNTDVCTNNVFVSGVDNNVKQHMTAFTLGLGARGKMVFSPDYATTTSGDFYSVKTGQTATAGPPVICSWQSSGPCNWPIPSSGATENIDDLWHAAIDGRGNYFSATDPKSLSDGLGNALSSITARKGSAAAAATSTLNPVPGNNLAYLASYTTVKWTGNLEARSINVDTGAISTADTWCAENTAATTCLAPGSIVIDNSGSSTVYNCVTPDNTGTSCSGTWNSVANTCSVQVPPSCTGTMPGRVSATSDTRTIYTASSDSSATPALV